MAIAAAHRAIAPTRAEPNSPSSWHRAGQAASILSAILLVVPLYLIAIELFGGRVPWLGVFLFYASPVVAAMLADVLSESTFLLFWCWGLWCAFRFLRLGSFRWLPPMIGFGCLAYLSRPEGLLLPLAMVATLALMPLMPSTRLNWPRWWAAVGLLIVGPALVVVPFVAIKGGIGTKPAVQKLLGMAPRAAVDAVERAKPLDPSQSEARTCLLAGKAVWEALRDITTPALVPLAVVGLIVGYRRGKDRRRAWLLAGLLLIASLLALIRLHVTGGYCTPRHASVLAILLIPAAAFGLEYLLGLISIPGRFLGLGEGRFRPGAAIWAVLLAAQLAWAWPEIARPINHDFIGYRQAAAVIAERAEPGAEIVDATGWSQFYAERPGYTFANLRDATVDPDLRWVVVRESHIKGSWWYCEVLRHLVGRRRPIETLPPEPEPGQSRVFVFDLETPEGAVASWDPPTRTR